MQILANFVWLCIHWSNSTLHSFSKTKQKIFSLFCCLFLGEHSEIDVNSKPKKKAVVKDFPCYHWNADCLAAHNLKKKKINWSLYNTNHCNRTRTHNYSVHNWTLTIAIWCDFLNKPWLFNIKWWQRNFHCKGRPLK